MIIPRGVNDLNLGMGVHVCGMHVCVTEGGRKGGWERRHPLNNRRGQRLTQSVIIKLC